VTPFIIFGDDVVLTVITEVYKHVDLNTKQVLKLLVNKFNWQ